MVSSSSGVKAAFDARLKRRIADHPKRYPQHNNKEKKSANGNKALDNLLEILSEKPFWIWNDKQHESERQKHGGLCCWNDIIGLPENKRGLPSGLFPYEKMVIDAYEQHKQVWILKSTGLGITELTNRYLCYLATRNNDLQGYQMCIVTGPRLELAVTLIDRMKQLFYGHGVNFDTDKTVIELNGCHIQAYPSHHLFSMRGLTKVRAIFLDEADFFPIGMQVEARHVSERYIAKSSPLGSPLIIITSTPNAPEGLMETIEREEPSIYHKIFLPYDLGIGYIYTAEDIECAKKSSSFAREYCLQYLGTEGNVFSAEVIANAIEAGKTYDPDKIIYEAPKAIGIDPGWGSSRFGVVLVQLANGRIEVLYAQEFERPLFTEVVKEVIKLAARYSGGIGPLKYYVDAANPSIITALKREIGERVDYETVIADLKARKIPEDRWLKWMVVNPVVFGAGGSVDMLAHTKFLMDAGIIAINPQFTKLITSLRTAVSTEGKLDKPQTSYNDLFDGLRCALQYFKIAKPKTPMYPTSRRL